MECGSFGTHILRQERTNCSAAANGTTNLLNALYS